MSSESNRVIVGFARDEYEQFFQLARRSNTSVSALGQVAYRHLLLNAQGGAATALLTDVAAADDDVSVATKTRMRVSVALTPEELAQVRALADQCGTSASTLGQVAYRHLLAQVRGGATPMLPPVQPAEDVLIDEAFRAGRLVSLDAQREETFDELDRLRSRTNELDALIELDRLASLTGSET